MTHSNGNKEYNFEGFPQIENENLTQLLERLMQQINDDLREFNRRQQNGEEEDQILRDMYPDMPEPLA